MIFDSLKPKVTLLHIFLPFIIFLTVILFTHNEKCACAQVSTEGLKVHENKDLSNENMKIPIPADIDIHRTSRHLNCDADKTSMKQFSRYFWDMKPNDPEQYGCKMIEILDWALNLRTKEKRVYSQFGEDGVLEEIFKKIGEQSQFYVEFGVQNGSQCMTRNFREKGWKGIMFDNDYSNPEIGLRRASVWIDNVIQLFQNNSVPIVFDLLSVDTNFNDFWNLRAIIRGGFRPRVVIVEVNVASGPYASFTIPLKEAEKHGMWLDGTRYFGGNVLAYEKLMHAFGYQLLYLESTGVNAIFIKSSEINNINLARALWQRQQFAGLHPHIGFSGPHSHPMDHINRPFEHICEYLPCDSSYDF